MKAKSALTLKQYYKLGVAIKFHMASHVSGVFILMQTHVPGYETPIVEVDAFTFRAHRRHLKFLGFYKDEYTIELYYQPRKIIAA